MYKIICGKHRYHEIVDSKRMTIILITDIPQA